MTEFSMSPMSPMPLVSAERVRTHFGGHSGGPGGGPLRSLGRRRGLPPVRAVDDVSMTISPGERVGLVGESGSGKTTLARTLLGLTPATGGDIHVGGMDVRRARRTDRRRLRATAQLIHQDPHASLSPRLRVSALLAEPYRIHATPAGERYPVEELLDMVGLPGEVAGKHPHELSGGQARRVSIARAIALRPRLLVADEPTAGLDVSAAAEILNLLRDLADHLGLAYLIVTHNLDTVAFAAERIAVMYLGHIVEQGRTRELFHHPSHPYTRALLSCLPEPDPDAAPGGAPVTGEVPSPRHPPPGCAFHPRCPLTADRCRSEAPVARTVEAGHDPRRQVACHLAETVLEGEHRT